MPPPTVSDSVRVRLYNIKPISVCLSNNHLSVFPSNSYNLKSVSFYPELFTCYQHILSHKPHIYKNHNSDLCFLYVSVASSPAPSSPLLRGNYIFFARPTSINSKPMISHTFIIFIPSFLPRFHYFMV